MAWGTIATAVTGDIVPAAYGNRIRDSVHYLKGQAGAVSIENSLTATALIAQTVTAGPGGAAQFSLYDRTTANVWVFYASGGLLRFYDGGTGLEPIQIAQGSTAMTWSSVNDINSGIPPTRLRRVTRAGMLGAGGGTQSLAYNGDGTLLYIHYPDGINAVTTISFEYSGGQVVAIRLRDGGLGGGVLNSVTFGYSGGQVTSIAQS